jgi:hypothetical protein
MRTLNWLACWIALAALDGTASGDEEAPPASAVADRTQRNCPLPQSGPFSVQCGDRGWLLSTRAGPPFFSIGVDVVDPGPAEGEYDKANPAYASWRYYRSKDEWASATLRRLKNWKFSTIGGWSDLESLNASQEQSLYLAPVIPLGAGIGAPWLDMWDPQKLAALEKDAAKRIGPLKNDPRVIGYYCDNELGWWNAALWKLTLESKAECEQRRRLIAMLRQIYGEDWTRLTKDFIPSEGVNNWQAIERGGALHLRAGGEGVSTMRKFLSIVAERYYSIMRDVVRRHDPDALFLGDRYQSFYYPEVARAAGKYVDIVSTNLSASWNDGCFVRFYLKSLNRLTGKPTIVSEFYAAATENRSRDKNTGKGFPVAPTQDDRAEATRRSLESLTRDPTVVGVEWFQYTDEPPGGREDGENYNFGLVDIEDRPYEELTQVFATFDLEKALKARRAPRIDAAAGVPPAPADPFDRLGYMTSLMSWNRERGFVPPATESPLADLYISWDAEAVYLGVYAIDPVEKSYYADAQIPEIDRANWLIRLGDGQEVSVRIGGGLPATTSDQTVRAEGYSGVDNDVRLIGVARIPAVMVGKKRFSKGDCISLQSSLTSHGRAYHSEWRGDFKLSE